jgi:hypothetical protein
MNMNNGLKKSNETIIPEEFITVSISWIFNFLCIYILINSKFLGCSEERCKTSNKNIDIPSEGRITWRD